MDIKALGTSIKQRRKSLNITQEKLAEMLDVSTHYVYELERGIKIPSVPMLINIAELFNTSLDSLLSSGDRGDNNFDELDVLIKSLPQGRRKEIYDLLNYLLPKLK